jgi:predicted TIM-barrel fold metal-dependent hydrolase
VIIDAHTHIYPDTVAERALNKVVSNMNGRLDTFTDGTLHGLLTSMDHAGIDASIVLPVATGPGQGSGIFEWIQQIVAVSKRLIFFGSVHPYDKDCLDLVREMKGYGLHGLKFHPGYQGFPVDSKAAYAVYETAAKHDLVLYFHAGFDPSLPECDYCAVDRFASFLQDFSGCRIVLAHGGGMGEWDRVLDVIGDRHCYYDIAFVLEEMKRSESGSALYRQNEDYFIFGSDSPWREQKQYVDLIRNSDTLSPDQKEKLFCRNVQKLLNL